MSADEIPPVDDAPPTIEFVEDQPPAHRTARRRQPAPKATASGRTQASEREARAAAGVLAQVNSLAIFGIMAVGYHGTASALANGNEGFEEQAYDALVNDPALCKSILRAGQAGGKAALILAYGMLVLGAAPVAIAEAKEKTREKAERKAAKQDAAQAEKRAEYFAGNDDL